MLPFRAMTSFSAPDHAYFLELADYSRDFIARLALADEAQPLDRLLGELKPRLERMRDAETSIIGAIQRRMASRSHDTGRAIGLNTVSLLADRLTILVVKEWNLRVRGANQAAADTLSRSEIPEICRALAQAEPDQALYVGKISTIRAGAKADTWAEAYYGLLSANILLWEAQEILYRRDILELPADEVRSYIRWFSLGNMLRNEYMALCEQLFWQQT